VKAGQQPQDGRKGNTTMLDERRTSRQPTQPTQQARHAAFDVARQERVEQRKADRMMSALRQRARWLMWCDGLSRLIAVALAAVVVAGAVDWCLKLEDLGLRIILSLTVWGLVAVVAWRYVWQPLRVPLSDLFLAQQIERRYPGYEGRVTSAVEFQASGYDARQGSTAWQQWLVRQARADFARVEPSEVITHRAIRAPLLAGLLANLVAVCCLVAVPLEAATAVKRLAWPFAHTPWPRQTVWELLSADGGLLPHHPEEPLRLLVGETLRLGAVNARGRLPSEVWLEVATVPVSPMGHMALDPNDTATGESPSDNAREPISVKAGESSSDHIGEPASAAAVNAATPSPEATSALPNEVASAPSEASAAPAAEATVSRSTGLSSTAPAPQIQRFRLQTGPWPDPANLAISPGGNRVAANASSEDSPSASRSTGTSPATAAQSAAEAPNPLPSERLPSDGNPSPTASSSAADGASRSSTSIPTSNDAASGLPRQAALIELPIGRQPLAFRVTGGDDDTMPWYRVEPVEPARFAAIQMTIQPPGYTGQPPVVFPSAARKVTALLGSTITWDCRVSRPVRSVQLARRGQAPQSIELSATRQEFTATWVVESAETVAVWFELLDLQGFPGEPPMEFEIQGQVDAIPTVDLLEPAADLLVTPTAEIPREISARDDGGVTRLRWFWQKQAGPSDHQWLQEWTVPEAAVSLREPWQLAPLGFAPGDIILARAEAFDACTVGPEHVGKSQQRILRVVSSREKEQELTERTAELVTDLTESRQLQQQAALLAQNLTSQLEQTGTFRPEDLETLSRLEVAQNQIQERLTDPVRGALRYATTLEQEFDRNQLSQPSLQEQLRNTADQLNQLQQEPLSRLQQDLTQLSKRLTPGSTVDPQTTREELARVESAQAELEDGLSGILDQLQAWRSDQIQNQELANLLDQQQQLTDDSHELSGRLLGLSSATLTPQQRADLEKLALRQRQLAQRLEQWSSQLSASKKNTSPSTAPDAEASPAADAPPDASASNAVERDNNPVAATDAAKPAASNSETTFAEPPGASSPADSEATHPSSAPASSPPKSASDVATPPASPSDNPEELGPPNPLSDPAAEAAGGPAMADESTTPVEEMLTEELGQRQPVMKLRQAAEALSDNRLVEATQAQQQAVQDLQALQELYNGASEDDLELLQKRLSDTESAVEQLQQQHEELTEQLTKTSSNENAPQQMQELLQQQLQLEQQLRQIERELERLRLERGPELARQARQQQRRLTQSLRQGGNSEAARQAAQDVAEQLEALDEELQQAQQELAAELAQEELLKTAALLQSLQQRQKALLVEMVRLETERSERGNWSRGQLRSLKDLAANQADLAHQADGLTKQLQPAMAFSSVMSFITQRMQRVAAQLDQRQTGPSTQAAAQAILDRLQWLIDAWDQAAADPQTPSPKESDSADDKSQAPPTERTSAAPPGEAVPVLAQLRLVRSLQHDCNQRTAAWDSAHPEGTSPTPDEQQELNELADEAAELRRLLDELLLQLVPPEPLPGSQPGKTEPGTPDANADPAPETRKDTP
jgi:hypothetical protein